MATIFKICPAALWRVAESEGVFRGSAVDARDGFIHFSTDAQVIETAARHFSGQCDLLLIAVDSERLGAALAWEPARSGDHFPHLYGSLGLAAVLWVEALPLDSDGRHRFPALAR
jgi:uncharacterized protein (DUF952 family)